LCHSHEDGNPESLLGARTLDLRLRGDDTVLKNMRTDPLFNIEAPGLNPREIEPIEKSGRVNNDKKKPENLDKEKPFSAKVSKGEEEKPLPPDPFGEKGKNIDVVG
jgi:hypothetical protein